MYESGHRCSRRVNSAKAERGWMPARSRRGWELRSGTERGLHLHLPPHPGMEKTGLWCCCPFAVKDKAERSVLVPGAEVRRRGIQLVREQVTSAFRTALVLWVTPYHTRPGVREPGRPLGRLSLSARSRLQGPAGLRSGGGSQMLQAQGSLLRGKGTDRDFQQGEL